MKKDRLTPRPDVVAFTRTLRPDVVAFTRRCDAVCCCRYTGLLCWDPEARIEPHFDSNRPYLAQRAFSALVYLDDQGVDFEGGSFAFDRLAHGVQVVRPRAGLFLAFDSGADNVHWVERVESGERTVLTLWFTRDEAHNEDVLLRAIGPRRMRPHMSERDRQVVELALRRSRLVVRGHLHDSPDASVSASADDSADATNGAAAPATRKRARVNRRAVRHRSLNELMQLAAFAEWRHGATYGGVLASGAGCELELWQEWRDYKETLETAYASWLVEWEACGHMFDVGTHTPPPSWRSLPRR